MKRLIERILDIPGRRGLVVTVIAITAAGTAVTLLIMIGFWALDSWIEPKMAPPLQCIMLDKDCLR